MKGFPDAVPVLATIFFAVEEVLVALGSAAANAGTSKVIKTNVEKSMIDFRRRGWMM